MCMYVKLPMNTWVIIQIRCECVHGRAEDFEKSLYVKHVFVEFNYDYVKYRLIPW